MYYLANACFLILGDFNSLDVRFFGRNLHFKQLVKQNTRANKILDMIFTNFEQNFVEPAILPPLGKSDHNCVYLSSSGVRRAAADVRFVSRRIFSNAAVDNVAKELASINWSNMYCNDDCQQQADMLYSSLISIVDKCAPIKKLKLKETDKPWITDYFKELILCRNTAFRNGDIDVYHNLRNKINRERKILQNRFFAQRIRNLKQ